MESTSSNNINKCTTLVLSLLPAVAHATEIREIRTDRTVTTVTTYASAFCTSASSTMVIFSSSHLFVEAAAIGTTTHSKSMLSQQQ
jgi:hypothetical protein